MDSLASIAMGFGVHVLCSVPRGDKIFLNSTAVGPLSTYPMSIGDFFPRVRWPGRQSNHSPVFGSEVKNDETLCYVFRSGD
jgi:hypothetical protein